MTVAHLEGVSCHLNFVLLPACCPPAFDIQWKYSFHPVWAWSSNCRIHWSDLVHPVMDILHKYMCGVCGCRAAAIARKELLHILKLASPLLWVIQMPSIYLPAVVAFRPITLVRFLDSKWLHFYPEDTSAWCGTHQMPRQSSVAKCNVRQLCRAV